MCSIRFHHVHSFLLGVYSSLFEPRKCIFGPLWRPLVRSAQGSRLVRLVVAPP